MKFSRRYCLVPLLALASIARCELATSAQQPPIATLDPEMEVNRVAKDGLSWHDVTTWGVEGRILPDQERKVWFDRLPAAADGAVTPSVWNLSRDSAGMMVRFKTDASAIHVHYKLRKANLAMPPICRFTMVSNR